MPLLLYNGNKNGSLGKKKVNFLKMKNASTKEAFITISQT